ncbi:Fc receptor-like protein 2 [Mixophyes fleayi]|uniref:Fc receptor-like protein 2 n=1 Tax=Mixophyes fleayi TaxID=3061075 RepID=UPI003F4E1035
MVAQGQQPCRSTLRQEPILSVLPAALFRTLQIINIQSSVTEGDDMTLICITRRNPDRSISRLQYAFYRAGRNVQEFSVSDRYRVPSAQLEDSGNYTCDVRTSTGSVRNMSDVLSIQIEELFSYPEIKKSSHATINGDDINLTCDTTLAPLRDTTELQFAFYRDGRNVQEFSVSDTYRVPSAQLEDSGDYYCEVRTSAGLVMKTSHDLYIPFTIIPAIYLLIRNIQSSLTEGDDLALTCVTESANTKQQFGFFKEAKKNKFDNRVQQFSSSDTYRVPSAQPEDSGNYRCAVRTYKTGPWTMSNVLSIQIKAIFTTPKLRNNQSSVTEGDDMTLTCDTTRYSVTESTTTEMKFAFYRDWRKVQEFRVSDTYRVPSAQLEDSGNYTCDVRTSTDNVRKRSSMLSVRIKALFTTPKLRNNQSSVTEGDDMTLTCDTTRTSATTELQFAFYRDGRNVQEFSVSDTYRVPSAQLEDSGNYTCEVRTISGSVRKRSNVLYIQIEELFTYPEMKMVPNTINEGDDMTLTCDTTPAPLRDTTELEFAFYRDGRNVQEFSVSDTYRVPSAQLEDSGDYTCDVRTSNDRMRRMSAVLSIQIEAYTIQNIIILVLSGCVLVVAVCLIIYHNKPQHEAVVQAAFRKGVSQQEDQLD